ncbi:hypothetical protein C1H46_041094 [Malus baccata]|uniref:Uncharacterized protein n=1 Tax=Malus baccata TaxID=106549 RepID=A0A540KGM2_MALBA|nr:hypothetical protein C1H46_041094 [Malus baccata]
MIYQRTAEERAGRKSCSGCTGDARVALVVSRLPQLSSYRDCSGRTCVDFMHNAKP